MMSNKTPLKFQLDNTNLSSDKMVRRFWWAFLIWGAGAIVWLGALTTLVLVAWHFIHKWW
jgi:hypothetical protein